MPIEKTIHKDLALVYSRWEGQITIEDIIAAQTQCEAMADYDPSFEYVIDLRDVTDPQLDYARFDEVMAVLKTPGDGTTSADAPPKASATVLATSDVTFGIARQFQAFGALRGAVDVSVFRSIETLVAHARRPTGALYQILGGPGATA